MPLTRVNSTSLTHPSLFGGFILCALLPVMALCQSANERAEILSRRAGSEFMDGKMTAAVKHFEEAGNLAPLSDADAFTLAMALVNLGDEPHARALLKNLSDKHPTQAIYIYWLGRLDYSQRRYQEAIEKLTRASDLDPGSARVWDSLGLAFDMQGLVDDALRALQKAEKLNRTLAHPSAWPPHDLGFLLLRMDRQQEAEASLREALRYDPNFAQAHYHLARALEKQARNTEAIAEYRTAISLDGASPDACYSLAMLYRKLHRDSEAAATIAEYKRRKQGALEELAKSHG